MYWPAIATILGATLLILTTLVMAQSFFVRYVDLHKKADDVAMPDDDDDDDTEKVDVDGKKEMKD